MLFVADLAAFLRHTGFAGDREQNDEYGNPNKSDDGNGDECHTAVERLRLGIILGHDVSSNVKTLIRLRFLQASALA